MRNDFAILIIILGCILLLALTSNLKRKEGFDDPIAAHTAFEHSQLEKNNPIGLILTASQNQGALGESADSCVGTFGKDINLPLESGVSGIAKKIKLCEAVTTAQCSAFDNADFKTDCGICLDIGTNSKNTPATGGLVLLTDEKEYAKSNTSGNFVPEYKPTVGSCPAGRFVATKSECLKVQAQINCEKNANYDLANCSQCYSDTTYSIVDTSKSAGVVA
jgi:hypothetical protein